MLDEAIEYFKTLQLQVQVDYLYRVYLKITLGIYFRAS